VISEMTLEQFLPHAAWLAAIHVIVSRDPGGTTECKGIVENDDFVVVPVKQD